MPIVFDAKEKTALATSVVADERQSVQNTDRQCKIDCVNSEKVV